MNNSRSDRGIMRASDSWIVKTFVCIAGLAIVGGLWYEIGLRWPQEMFPRAIGNSDPQTLRAQLGDQFGMVNSLFAAFTLFGVMVALVLQIMAARTADAQHHEEMQFQRHANSMPLVVDLMKEVKTPSWARCLEAVRAWGEKHTNLHALYFQMAKDSKSPMEPIVEPYLREFMTPFELAWRLHEADSLTDKAFMAVVFADYAKTIIEVAWDLQSIIDPKGETYGISLVRRLYPAFKPIAKTAFSDGEMNARSSATPGS